MTAAVKFNNFDVTRRNYNVNGKQILTTQNLIIKQWNKLET